MEIKGYKTIILNVLGSILPVLEATDMTALITDPKMWTWYVLGMAIANAVMRAFTDTPILKSK